MNHVWAVLDGFMAITAALLTLRLALLIAMAGWDVLRRHSRPSPVEPPTGVAWPRITVLVPAFNEERVLAGVIRSILGCDYPDLSVLVIDDGSTDGTLALARSLSSMDPRVRALAQVPNQGKAEALNAALAVVDTEVVVSVDADTILAPDALRLLVAPLLHGADACSCNLKVGNRSSWLLHWQSVEYILGLNLTRRAQATLGCITTIPGAAAGFRVEALRAAGGWSSDTRTEDTDLTLILLAQGRRVVYEPRARAYTEAPDTIRALLRQRTRWLHGYLACLWKHRRSFLRLDALGWFGMPNLLFLHLLVFPYFLVSLAYTVRVTQWTGPGAIPAFLVGFLWLDLLLASCAYLVDREDWKELWHAPFWRLGWPFFLLVVFARAWHHVLTGRQVPWHKAARIGKVADGVPPLISG